MIYVSIGPSFYIVFLQRLAAKKSSLAIVVEQQLNKMSPLFN